MEQTLNTWSIQLAYIFLMVIVIFVFLLYMRHRIARLCRDNVLCEFITNIGTGYPKFVPVNEGKIEINKKDGKGRTYAINSLCTYIVDYPSVPGFLSFMQSKARKTILDEETGEPLTNRSSLLLITPHRLWNWSTEKFTGIATKQSEAQADKTLKTAKKSSASSWTWVIILLVIAAVAVGGYFVVQKMNASNAALGISMINQLMGYL